MLTSDTNDVTHVDLSSIPAGFKVGAIYLNQDDFAYAKLRFDPASMSWFKRNLHLISDPQTRAEIWRYFWVSVREER